MSTVGKYLVQELINEIENITDYVVVYSGRFQPFHKGHFATYQHLVKKFGKGNVYIGTSDKTDKLKSPFNFKEKQTIMMKMFGIPSNRIIQIKNPYAPVEILKKFDKDTTAFITVVGEKDEQRLGGKYFTPYKGEFEAGYADKGYVYISPAQPNAISGTDVRNWLGSGEIEDRKKLFSKAYPKFDEKIFNLITTKLSSLTESSPKNVKKKQERYYDLDKINERIFIPKEFIEEWIDLNLNHILSEITTSTTGPATSVGKNVDDGPNFFFPNYDTFDLISKERAEQIGYTVFKQIMSGELEDYYEHPIYPNGPVKAVTPFPAGVIGKTTATNQKDLFGDDAYEKWYNHVTRSMALVGYQLVKDFDKSSKDLAIQSADNIKKVAGIEKIKDTVMESGMGLAMGYPSKEQLLQKKRERDKLRAQMDRESEYYEPIEEDITIPLNVGDTVLGGKFKNKKIVVKDIGKNEKGEVTVNGKPLLKYRLIDEVVEETINESIINDVFLKILKLLLTAAGAGFASAAAYILRVVGGYIVDVLLNGISNYAKSVKNLVSPDSFTKFTTELSKSKEFNKKFINILIKHGGLKNTNVVAFLNEVENTKEFNDILYKYYPKETNKFNTNERNEAVREFRNGIRNTLKEKGGWLIKTIKNKFPELKDVNTESILFEIPMDDLQQLDKFADKQMSPIDVVLTGRHFLDRLVDKRNVKPISVAELTGFFKRLARKKTEFVEFLKKYGEIVAKDNRTKINIPFMQQANKAIAKTIMRKDDFKTPSPELKFEGLKESSGIDGLGGGNNSARYTAPGQSKKLKIPQLSGYEQMEFPIADELDTSNEKYSWHGIGKTKKYNNKVRAIRKDDGSLVFEATSKGKMYEPKRIKAYYEALCKSEGVKPLPVKFEAVSKGGAATTYNSKTMKPLYISFNVNRLSDPEFAIIHELTHQIKLETEGDAYVGKRDQLAKFKKLENRLIDKYVYSNYSKLLYENLNEDTIKHISKSLGVSRDKMPQINSKDVGEFVKYLKDKGVSSSSSVIDVSKVGMTQKDINVDKVKDLLGVEKSNLAKPVIISKDNYILDGHHRIVALYNIDKNFKLKTIKVDLGIKDLLSVAKQFPKVSFKGITEFYGNYDTRHVRPAAPMKGLGEPDDNHKDVE